MKSDLIRSMSYTKNKVILNDCVTLWFENGKIRSEYDTKSITQDDSIKIINEYLQSFNKIFKK